MYTNKYMKKDTTRTWLNINLPKSEHADYKNHAITVNQRVSAAIRAFLQLWVQGQFTEEIDAQINISGRRNSRFAKPIDKHS